MELEIVAGTYDCMIKGFSIDALTPEEKVRKHFTAVSAHGIILLFACVLKVWNIVLFHSLGTRLDLERPLCKSVYATQWS